MPGGRVQFLDRPVGTNGNGAQASDGARIDAAGAQGHARVENTREDIRGGTPIEKAGGCVLHCLDNSAQPDALGAGRQPCSDAVDMMIEMNNFTIPYAKALVASTPPEQLVGTDAPRAPKGVGSRTCCQPISTARCAISATPNWTGSWKRSPPRPGGGAAGRQDV